MAQTLPEPDKSAALFAANQLAKQYGPVQAARLCGIKQQTFSAIVVKGSVGLDSMKKLARYYGETHDSFVERFSPGEGKKRKPTVNLRVGDLVGWEDARREAESRWGARIPAWAWRITEDIRLPARPTEVSRELAYELADFVSRFCQASGIVRVDRRTD